MKDFLVSKIKELAFATVEINEPLWASGVLDSISIVELAVEIEAEYRIQVLSEEINEDNFQTVEKMISFIESKLN